MKTLMKTTILLSTSIAFVEEVATEDSGSFVPVVDRIAVFDNDGTLWTENPLPIEVAFTHAGMSPDDFDKRVTNWLATAKNQRFDRSYNECVYQPMLELLMKADWRAIFPEAE